MRWGSIQMLGKKTETDQDQGSTNEALITVHRKKREWRETLLQGLLWSTSSSVILASLFALQNSMMRWATAPFVVIATVLLVVTLASRVSLTLRAGILIFGLYAACVVALLVDGIAPNALIGLAVASGISTMLLGRAQGVAVLALTILTLVLIFSGNGLGLIDRPDNWFLSFDTAKPMVAARIVLIFLAGSGVLVFGISHLVGQGENLLEDYAQALGEVQRQQAEAARLAQILELQQAAIRRAEDVELLSRLSAYATHDFNNALQVIGGAVQLIRDDMNDRSRLVESLQMIAEASSSAGETAKELREFCGPQGGKGAKIKNTGEELRRISRMLEQVLPSRVSVEVEAQSEEGIECDATTFQRAVLNLALNARDAMPNGGSFRLVLRDAVPEELTWAAEPTAGYLCLVASDTGVGMDEALQKQAFEPFFTTKGPKGTGLGLASLRETLSARGGHVTLASSPGDGTTFTTFWKRSRSSLQSLS